VVQALSGRGKQGTGRPTARSSGGLGAGHRDPLAAADTGTEKKYPSWGSKKLFARLRRLHGSEKVPSRATISRILKQLGLVKHRTRRRAKAGPERVDPRRLESERDTPSGNVPTPVRPGAIDISRDVKLGIFRSKSKLVVRFQALKPGLGVRLRLERVLRNYQRFF
jgi:hypothetical protein